jgi:hypothetical protein
MKVSKYNLFLWVALIFIGMVFFSPVLAQEKGVREALKASDIRSLDPH